MSRLVNALCLAMSLLAIVLAISLGRGGDRPVARSLPEDLEQAIRRLGDRVDRLEARDSGRVISSARREPAASSDDPVVEPGLNAQLASLQARLVTLEDAETIAKLAADGGRRIRVQSGERLLGELLDADLSPAERQSRILEHWEAHGEIHEFLTDMGIDEDESALALFSLAQDPGLEEEVRVQLLAEISDSGVAELREPLLGLLFNDVSPTMRQQAARNLVVHAEDVGVQNAILAASREDESEEVRGTAGRRLEELREIAREATPGSPVALLADDEIPRREQGEYLEFFSGGVQLRMLGDVSPINLNETR